MFYVIFSRFVLGLGFTKYGAPYSVWFYFSSTPRRTKPSTYFLNIHSCTFVTRYGFERIGFALYFNLKTTGYVFEPPSVPSDNSS